MTKEQAIEKAKEQYSEIWDCDINHPKYEDTVEEIVTGVIRLIMQPTSDDCVSRQAVLDKKVLIELPDGQSFYCIGLEDVKDLSPVTPTHGTCEDCKRSHELSGGSIVCDKLSCIDVEKDFYCKDFEKRGSENE